MLLIIIIIINNLYLYLYKINRGKILIQFIN